jgi:hypothetical protein
MVLATPATGLLPIRLHTATRRLRDMRRGMAVTVMHQVMVPPHPRFIYNSGGARVVGTTWGDGRH